jgi:ribosomal protein S27E
VVGKDARTPEPADKGASMTPAPVHPLRCSPSRSKYETMSNGVYLNAKCPLCKKRTKMVVKKIFKEIKCSHCKNEFVTTKDDVSLIIASSILRKEREQG